MALTRIGILGCGKIARHHAAAIHAAGGNVVAGSTRRANSPNWSAFLGVAPGARFVPDGTALLDADDVEAIVVCLPWHEMPQWTGRLLAHPKPMLIEKPLALASDALESALSAKAPDKKLIGFNRRFYAPVRAIADRLAQGGLKAVHAVLSEDIARHIEGHGPRVLEHLMAYASSHALDLLLHLLGPLQVVSGDRYAERGYPAPLTSFNGLLRTAAGRPVFLSLNADDPTSAGFRFLFDDHTSWQLSPLERLRVFKGYDIVAEKQDSAIRQYIPRQIQELVEPSTLKPGFLAQAQAFLEGRYGPGARPADSLDLLRLIDSLTP